MNDGKPLLKLLSNQPLWGQNETPIWLSSRFSLRRNLADFSFPAKMNDLEKEQLVTLLKNTLIRSSTHRFGLSFPATELSAAEKELLSEHFFMDLKENPHFYLIDSSGSFIVKIQGQDHLTLECLESESNWNTNLQKLSSLEKEVGKMHHYAFNSQFGYLSSDPSFSGTGLKAEAFLHVPCLIHMESPQEILENVLVDDLSVSGLYGNTGFTGDIMAIQNKFTLGISEDHILDCVHRAATELMSLEARKRQKLKEKPDPIMLDKVSRAYGLLLHSFQIELKEAFAALSLLKLGIDLEWVEGMADQEISAIFCRCRRGHLRLAAKLSGAPDELTRKRAEYLKTECKKLKLVI